MHQRTLATLEALRQKEWFINVGLHDTDMADVLGSWQEAIASCKSIAWETLCIEAANQYRQRLQERICFDREKWNDIVDNLKPLAQAIVREKTSGTIIPHDLREDFLAELDWNILHLFMEAEFSDIYPPGFYASHAYWYSVGHFPCGWRGQFPQGGRLLIY